MSENIDAEMLLRILDQVPGAPWAFRLDPVAVTSAWIYRSPQLAETYALTEAELAGEPLALIRRLPPDEAAALQQKLMASMVTLTPMGWLERIAHASGEVRWVETRVRFQPEDGGKLLVFGQSFDVSEQKRAEYLYREALDALPAVVFALTPEGELPIYNRAAQQRLGSSPTVRDGDVVRRYEMFEADGVTPLAHDDSPIVRALRGEEAPEAEVILRGGSRAGDMCLQIRGTPVRDESGKIIAGVIVSQDLTDVRALDRELRTRNAQLAASEEAKSALIDRLRRSIDELSTPILEVWDDVLAMPLIGLLDSHRIADVVQRLLVEVARSQASFVIVDLTGVDAVDSRTADHLIKLIRKVEIVGARCVLTGIRPAVSEALVEIGADFGRITTLRNLKHGLREALRASRRDDGDGDEESEGPQASDGGRRRR